MNTFEVRHTIRYERESEYWKLYNPKIAQKIDRIIREIVYDPYKGLGKPEKLINSPYWSRRIDHKHRLIYEVMDDTVWLISCYGHYGDH